jgi:hypothetical protein
VVAEAVAVVVVDEAAVVAEAAVAAGRMTGTRSRIPYRDNFRR